MNIGQAATASGISAKMIRYYERIGLVRKAGRTGSGYRLYSDADILILQFIHRARVFGFSIERIRLLIKFSQGSSTSRDVKSVALEQMSELERRIAELVAMRDSLEQLVAVCPGDHRSECPILRALAGPPRPRAAAPAPYAEFRSEASDFPAWPA